MQDAPPRGTRDFYPEQMRIQKWLFGKWRACAEKSGFEEYGSSILEHEELYIRKSGQEIVGQLFNFEDKGGRRVALRPEMTPTLARMIAAKGSALPRPVKWYSVVQCFRYERMARGRRREHFQWNLDVIGVADVTAEAELLAVAVGALKSLGLTDADVVVRVSHRGLLSAALEGLGIASARWADVFGVIDKTGKESEAAIREQLVGLGLGEDTLARLFELMGTSRLDVFEGFLREHGLDTGPADDLRALFGHLDAYGIGPYCEFSPSIVRGLPYYTGVVFECFDRAGRFRAVFGGGRYDNLLDLFGAGDSPAAGLGFGDVVIQELLEERGVLPELPRALDFFVVPFSEAERPLAIRVVRRIREQGISADLPLTRKRLKAALKEAARVGARRVVLLMPDEVKEGLYVVRSMSTGQEERVAGERFEQDPGAWREGGEPRNGAGD